MKKMSVIIPCYNDAENVNNCLNSLEKQTVQPEIIVVDGGSKDNTKEIIKKHMAMKKNIGFFTEPPGKRCPANARNIGFQKSKGDFIMFLDCDQTISPDTIEKALRGFEKNPKADRIALKVKIIEPKNFKSLIQKYFFYRDFRAEGTYWNAFITRKFFAKTGGYNPNLGFGEDRELEANREIKLGVKVVNYNEEIKLSKPADIITIKDVSNRYKWYGRTVPAYLKVTKDFNVLFPYIFIVLSIPLIPLLIFPFLRGIYLSFNVFKNSKDSRIFLIAPILESSSWVFMCFGFWQWLLGNKTKGR